MPPLYQFFENQKLNNIFWFLVDYLVPLDNLIKILKISLVPTHSGRTIWTQKINGNFDNVINVSCIGSGNGGIAFIKGVGFTYTKSSVNVEFDNTGTSNNGSVSFLLALKSNEELSLNGVPTIVI